MEKEFLKLVHDYQKIIYKVCKMYRDRKEDQEDLFQEIVYQLCKSYSSFKGDSKISSWIYRISLNTAMAIYRKPKLTIDNFDVFPERIHPSSENIISENSERLFWALRKLNDPEKALISLYLEDFSYQEIAEIVGISESNVGVKLNRIKNKLKVILKEKIMELNDLKTEWQNANVSVKSEADLMKMTKVMNHPSLKSIRTKLIIETIGFVFFLVVYYDWFDGDQKPMYANALLVSSLLLYIVTDVIGYISVVKRIGGLDLKISLEKQLQRIKQLAAYSLICSVLYGISFLVFFSSVIHFTKEKSFLLLGLVIVLIQMLLWSRRIWTKWIKNLQQQVKDFELDK